MNQKTVHNISVRVTTRSETETRSMLSRVAELAKRTPEDSFSITVQQEDDEFHGELWIDRQQPVRKLLRTVLDGIGAEARALIAKHPSRHLDTGTHCFIHLDPASFAEGKIVMAQEGETVSVRLNLACWPVTREGAIQTLQRILAADPATL